MCRFLIAILDIFHMNIDCCTMYGAACWSHCETRQIYGKNYSIILLLHKPFLIYTKPTRNLDTGYDSIRVQKVWR